MSYPDIDPKSKTSVLLERYEGLPLSSRFAAPNGISSMPGGFGRSSLAMGRWIPVVTHGEGCRVWDESGREYLDANNNFTALVHGHAHVDVVNAMTSALRRGASFGLPNLLEYELAEILLTRAPPLSQIRFANSGTEAVMLAVRLARAYTGRDKVVFFNSSYHGLSDTALAATTSRGIPSGISRDVIVAPPNDLAGLEVLLDGNANAVAAIVIDLLPNRAGLIAADEKFVKSAQELCRRRGIALIVDEVVSYRLGFGGLVSEYEILPDLVVLGKLIGGGVPIGAVLGTAEIMQSLDPFSDDRVEHGGTFTGNPIAMAGGIASLGLLDLDEIVRLNRLGEAARLDLTSKVSALGWEVRGVGSLIRAFPIGATVQASTSIQRELWWQALSFGLLLGPGGLIALSTPMTDSAVTELVDRFVYALNAALA